MVAQILVVEDDTIVAGDLCDTCEEAGYRVLGPFAAISPAMLALQKERPDLAILDVGPNPGPVFAFAQRLAAENVPIVFRRKDLICATGTANYGSDFVRACTLAKPCPPSALLGTIQEMLQPAPAH
jgi:two-component system, response regulator PdtaR